MKLPTKKQAKGYDILLWIDEAGDVVCQSYTNSGASFLHTLDERHRLGDVLEIVQHPSDFKSKMPPELKVGIVSPMNKKVNKLKANPLH